VSPRLQNSSLGGLARPPWPSRLRALVAVVLSLAAWATWAHRFPNPHPWADLSRGVYTDHFSHMNAARAFARVGLAIYRKGAAELAPEVDYATRKQLPEDVRLGGSYTGGIYALPGMPVDKPWVTSWSTIARPYPPGDLLVVAPSAFLYERGVLSFARANALLVALFVLYAHVGYYVLARILDREQSWRTPVLALGALLLYAEATRSALEGFYDVAAIAPLLLAFEYLRERRALAASVAYAAAAFVHYRVFFFAPLPMYAVWVFLADRQWRALRARDAVAIATGLALAAATLGVFVILLPTLRSMEMINPVNVSVFGWRSPAVQTFAFVTLLALAPMVAARAWLDAAILAWMAFMCASLRQTMIWHVVIMLPWIVAPVIQGRRDASETVRAARMLFVVYVAVTIFRNPLWPAEWLPRLWRT
jgi:hypothetical protein